jgi:hypothetical protein
VIWGSKQPAKSPSETGFEQGGLGFGSLRERDAPLMRSERGSGSLGESGIAWEESPKTGALAWRRVDNAGAG